LTGREEEKNHRGEEKGMTKRKTTEEDMTVSQVK
jgi:hypothetical protein